MERSADYIVAGAGSAGCVLARRLAQSGATVILLEAGEVLASGSPEDGIAPGTRWDEVPPNWVCPECGARKLSLIHI